MTICREFFLLSMTVCDTHMRFDLEQRIWYCPKCGNAVRVPKEQRSLNEYTRKS